MLGVWLGTVLGVDDVTMDGKVCSNQICVRSIIVQSAKVYIHIVDLTDEWLVGDWSSPVKTKDLLVR